MAIETIYTDLNLKLLASVDMEFKGPALSAFMNQ